MSANAAAVINVATEAGVGIHGRVFQRKGCVFFRVNGFCTLQNIEKQPSFFFRSEAKDDAVVPDEGADGEGAWQVCCF